MDDRDFNRLYHDLEEAEFELRQITAKRDDLKSQVEEHKYLLFDLQMTVAQFLDFANEYSDGELWFSEIWLGSERVKDLGIHENGEWFYRDFYRHERLIPSDTVMYGNLKCLRSNTRLRSICEELTGKG